MAGCEVNVPGKSSFPFPFGTLYSRYMRSNKFQDNVSPPLILISDGECVCGHASAHQSY